MTISHHMIILGSCILLLVSAILINLVQFNRRNSKSTSETLDSSASQLFQYILDGTQTFLQASLKETVILPLIIACFLTVMSLTYGVSLLPTLLFLSGSMSAYLIGKIGTRLIQSSSRHLLHEATQSLEHCVSRVISQGKLALSLIIGLTLMDFIVWTFILDSLFDYNVAGLAERYYHHYFHQALSQTSSHNILQDLAFAKIIFSLMLVHALGYVFQALIARLYSAIFGVAADTTTDTSSYLHYDFLEDDLRNPGTIADQVGDIAKHGHSMIAIQTAILLLGCLCHGLFSLLYAETYAVSHYFLLSLSGVFILTLGMIATTITYWIPLSDRHDSHTFRQPVICAMILAILCSSLVFLNILTWIHFLVLTLGIGVQTLIVLMSSSSKKASVPSDTIMDHLLTGVLAGAATFWRYVLLFCIALGVIFTLSGSFSDETAALFSIGLFIMGILAHSLCLFVPYIGASAVDTALGVSHMTLAPKETIDRLDTLHQATLGSTLATKVSHSLCGIGLSIGLLFYYLVILKHFLPLSKPFMTIFQQLGIPLLELRIDDMFTLFHINLFNPEYLMGFLSGLLWCLSIITLITMGIKHAQQHMQFAIDQHLEDDPNIASGQSLPNYHQLIQIGSQSACYWTRLILGVIVLFPVIIACLFGISGTVGLLTGLLPLCFFTEGLGITIGLYWKKVKLIFGQQDAETNPSAYTNRLFCDSLGDILKDGLGSTLVIAMLTTFMVSITTCVIAVRLDVFIMP